jgi:hypothetical protein
MITKHRKACWHYWCPDCEYLAVAVDQFRAKEARQKHERTFEHAVTAVKAGFGPLMDAFASMASAAVSVGNQMRDAFAPLAPPPNIPHDPTLLNDKRKWGGK